MAALLTRRQAVCALASLSLAAQLRADNVSTIVVPYPAGGAPDYLARIIATKVGVALRSTYIIDNRPGANAIVGTRYVAAAKADGSTLLLVDRMTAVANPLLYKRLPYDPKSLKPVADVARINLVLTIRSDAPFKNWREFVDYAKANPEKLLMGSGGAGSVHHLSLELLAKSIDAKFTHVPYKGSPSAVRDLLGGQLSGVVSGPDVVRPYVGGGKIRVIAVGGDARMNLFPDVPTLRELGVTTPVLLPTTFSMFAPIGTSDASLAPLQDVLRSVVQTAEFRNRVAEQGMFPMISTPKEIADAMNEQRQQLATVIKEANIRLD